MLAGMKKHTRLIPRVFTLHEGLGCKYGLENRYRTSDRRHFLQTIRHGKKYSNCERTQGAIAFKVVRLGKESYNEYPTLNVANLRMLLPSSMAHTPQTTKCHAVVLDCE